MKKPWWLLLLLACVSRADLHAQGALIPVAFYAVQGAPFSLTVQTQWNMQRAVGPTQGTQRILRDSAGRQRYEAPMIDGVPRPYTMTIYDVAGGKIIVLDPAEKTAHVSPMHVGRSVVLDVSEATLLPPDTAAQNQTLLGVREIAGMEAWGQRTVRSTTRPDGQATTHERDLWLSTHYRMPLMQVLQTDRGTITQAVTEFTAAEPDPALFRIPAGYTVHEAPSPPDLPPGVARIGGDVSAPVLLKMVDPEFSEEARRKKLSGSVRVRLTVDENGMPEDVTVVQGVGAGLDEKALEAVRQYRFKPALRNGVPVKVVMNVEVRFQIFGHP